MDTDDIPALETIDAVIGARLRHERDSRRLSRAEVAAATGLSAKTIQRMEEGERSADVQQLDAITAVYGMSLHTFMTLALKGTRFARRAKSQSG
ncbi:helix-turn-helix domain-containing protein [Nocardia cyriacigeorgica]|uniref:helix-turn-helix domain-containing protein n=1 Tax=Nocardia cyriacigeorgica TaxID=135487 RepID=UPI002458697E|nr:helix-turn-helix transcriptional regulator [Nocardia cyriacigeorgica]